MRRHSSVCGKIEKQGKLVQLSQRTPVWYTEKSVVTKKGDDIVIIDKDGKYVLPVATIGCLMCGPGTKITNNAVRVINARRCLLSFVGECGAPVHSVAVDYRNITNKINQFKKSLDIKIVLKQRALLSRYRRKWTPKQFPVFPEDIDSLDNTSYLLSEARWAKHMYCVAAQNTDRDKLNSMMPLLNNYVYSLAFTVITHLGYEPGLGIIHSRTNGGGLVFDVADVYKPLLAVWLGSQSVKNNWTGSEIRKEYFTLVAKYEIVDNMVDLIQTMFSQE